MPEIMWYERVIDMLANYHTHTMRCQHARGSDREYVEAAIKSGLKILGFSDHCPWVYPDGYVSGCRMACDEIDDYFYSLSRLKKEYADDIKIYIGFESEYIPELMEAQDKLLSQYPVDYMILGEHTTVKEGKGVDPSSKKTTDEEVLRHYVDIVIEGMESGRYAYIAHPDLLNYVGSDEIFDKHYRRLCEYLKSKNIPVEINCLGIGLNRHYTSEKFLKIAQSVGNSAIIGIDAHMPEMISDRGQIKICGRLAEKYSLPLVDYLDGLC